MAAVTASQSSTSSSTRCNYVPVDDPVPRAMLGKRSTNLSIDDASRARRAAASTMAVNAVEMSLIACVWGLGRVKLPSSRMCVS